MSEEDKAKFRRVIEECFNQGNLATAEELIATDMVDHNPPPGIPQGLQGFKQMVTMFRSAFPDMHGQIEDVIAEGDKVVGRITFHGTHQGDFMGLPATGKRVSINEIHILRIANGKAVEHWGVEDNLGMMQQLGIVESPGQGG